MIPVLLYHSISDRPSGWALPFSVPPAAFREHLAVLRDAGCQPLTVSDLGRVWRGELPLPPRPVVVTVDDGFADALDVAAPLLSEREIAGTFFVTTGFLGGRSPGGDLMLSWRGVRELRDLGHEVGGHSVSHGELDVLSPARAKSEIVDCRNALQDALGEPVSSFAYPYGYSSPAVRRQVAATGWTSACSVRNAHAIVADPVYSISRLTVRHTTTVADIRGWLDGSARPRAWARDAVPVRVWRAYRRLRWLGRARTMAPPLRKSTL